MRENACGNFVFVCLFVFFSWGRGWGLFLRIVGKIAKSLKYERAKISCHGTLKCESATVTKLKRYENTRKISCDQYRVLCLLLSCTGTKGNCKAKTVKSWESSNRQIKVSLRTTTHLAKPLDESYRKRKGLLASKLQKSHVRTN